MKKKHSTLFSLALACGILVGGAPAELPELQESVQVEESVELAKTSATMTGTTTANLNVRSGAGTKYKVIASFKKGANITILSKHGGWYKVKAGSKTGYVSASYVKNVKTVTPAKKTTTTTAKKATATQNLGNGYSTASVQNVRSGAGTNYKKVGSIKRNVSYKITGQKNGWYQIQLNSKTKGWVSGSYFKKGNPPKATAKKVTTTKKNDGLDTFRYHMARAGCGNVKVEWNNYHITGAAYNHYGPSVYVGSKYNRNAVQYIATHECMHYKQHKESGFDWNKVLKRYGGLPKVECDADYRTARFLGYDVGHYTRNGKCR